MPSGRPPVVIDLSPAEREELQAMLRRRRIAKADAQRAQIILLASEGASTKAIETHTGLITPTVDKWRQRFLTHRMTGLSELPRSGAPRKVGDEQIEAIIQQTLESTPSLPPTGASARWPGAVGSRTRPSAASGARRF